MDINCETCLTCGDIYIIQKHDNFWFEQDGKVMIVTEQFSKMFELSHPRMEITKLENGNVRITSLDHVSYHPTLINIARMLDLIELRMKELKAKSKRCLIQ